MPMKRGFDITHGWLKTGFFDEGTSLQPAEYGKKPGFFGLDASKTIGFKGDRPYSLKDVATLPLMREFYGAICDRSQLKLKRSEKLNWQ